MERMDKAQAASKKWFGLATEHFSDDPDFEKIVLNFLCGDILQEGDLSDVERALLILTAIATTQTLDALPHYVEAALRVSARSEEIKETLYQCTPYIGLERVRSALAKANEALLKHNVSLPLESQSTVSEDTRLEKGLSVQQTIFGKDPINTMRKSAPKELQPLQDYLSAYCFGDFYTRKVLSIPMRELITFCALSSLGGCEPQVKSHVGANLSVGNSRETLICAIFQCLPFIGFPRTLNAIGCIDAVCSSSA